MASPNVLRSSPICVVRSVSRTNAPSSPDLPPLQEIFSRKPHEAAIPSALGTAIITEDLTPLTQSKSLYWQQSQPKPTATLERDTKISKHDEENPVGSSQSVVEVVAELAPSTTPSNRSGIDPATAPTYADKPWRKYKTKAIHTEATNASQHSSAAISAGPSIAIESKTQPSGEYVPRPSQSSKEVKRRQDRIIEPLQLEQAMTRKLDWTPPANKTYLELKSSPPGTKIEHSPSSPSNWKQSAVFRTLSDTYGCKDKDKPKEDLPRKVSYTVVKKRKLIELVAIKPAEDTQTAEPPEKPVAKRKATKKKPQTITALATAAYKTPTQPDPAPPSASLLDYFPAEGAAATPKEQDTAGKPKRTRKKTAKVSKKKAAPPKPVLLSPRAALKQVADQDFVFGTSSQLAREHSPSFLRNLQAAMQTSNYDEAGHFVALINSDAIEPPDQRPKLWDAGARDVEGDLLDLEVIDLVHNSPQLPPLIDESDPFGYHKNEGVGFAGGAATDVNTMQANDDSFVNLSDILPSPKSKPSPSGIHHSPSASEVPLEEFVQPLPGMTMSQNNMPETQRSEKIVQAKAAASNEPSRPKFELYTDARLSKEIMSYGFKPVKRRTAMIALLDQCWESRVRMSQNQLRMKSTTTKTVNNSLAGDTTSQYTQGVVESPGDIEVSRHLTGVSELEEQEPPPSAQPPLSPKRPRGRPRKDPSTPTKKTRAKTTSKKSTASTKTGAVAKAKKTTETVAQAKRKQKTSSVVIEIPDSASDGGSDLSASPSSSPEPTFSSPLPVDLSISMDEDTDMSLGAVPTDDQEALFSHVTKAVTTAPRTTDPSKPSWHEKILMYDPIVLEDLTAWLNSGQLTRVGFDGEISPGEVKQWCESKSICCLWKVNLRGKERKRF